MVHVNSRIGGLRAPALACVVGLMACQKAAAPPEGMATGGGDMPALATPPGGPDAAPSPGPVDLDCAAVRAEARRIRESNCAGCHQAPAKSGNFNFVLDDATLMGALSSTGQPFVVPMQPDNSRLYRRVAAGEMPPVGAKVKPDDVAILRRWITSCMVDSAPAATPDAGAGDAVAAATPDGAGPEAASEPEEGCGEPGQPCCVANGCQDGGCCVLGQCRASGQACGGTGSGGLAEGLPGVCSNGSCGEGAMACGNVSQPCCGDDGVCTAPGASCRMGTSCEACGGAGQPCCGNGGAATCLPGMSCSFTGFGRPSSCQACGGSGQPCCGNGSTGRKKCNEGLACHYVAGMGDRCGS